MTKNELLPILSGEVCPICQGLKHPHTWACRKCYQPHYETAEAHALSDACDAHMVAADAFLAMVKARHE